MPDRAATTVRIALALIAVPLATVGLWGLLAPRSFYDDFPGGGRTWVSVDGPFNEHFVRDFGSLNLALVVVLVVAIVTLNRLLVGTAAVAVLVNAVPHFLYHVTHLDVLGATSDQVGNVVSLGMAIVLPVVALVAVVSRPAAGPEPNRSEDLSTGR